MELSDPDFLISFVNKSLMTDSDDMKELDKFSFGTKAPAGLQPNGFESVKNQIPGLMLLGCCVLYEKMLVALRKVIHQS